MNKVSEEANDSSAAAKPHRRKRCFVISPIGEPGSEVREHADDVLVEIIQPAVEEAGYDVHRADHASGPGKITEEMFDWIFNDDLIIAILSDRNPNVYFELAVAQSAARPVIMMIVSKEQLPFDVKDERVIKYDLKPSSNRERKYAKELLAAIRKVETVHEHRVSFAPQKSPLGKDDGALTVITHQRDHRTEDYTQLLGSSKKFLMLSGISLNSWHSRVPYAEAMMRQVALGCSVQVLIMDAENPALGQMLNNTSILDNVQREIRASLKLWSELEAKHDRIQICTVKRGIIYQQSTLNENEVAYTPYYYSFATSDCPTFLAKAKSPIYRAQKHELDRLWRENAPVA